jgi:predicted kinase
MARLIIPCGIPGSGKSEFLKMLSVPPGLIFCPDALLQQKGIYDWSPNRVAEAWRKMYRRFGRAIQLVQQPDGTIVGDHRILAWDAMFLTAISRSPVINIGIGAGLSVEGLYFKTPIEVCLERNVARPPDRRVPEAKLRAWAEALEEPQLHEGYTDLTVVTPENNRNILTRYLSRHASTGVSAEHH